MPYALELLLPAVLLADKIDCTSKFLSLLPLNRSKSPADIRQWAIFGIKWREQTRV